MPTFLKAITRICYIYGLIDPLSGTVRYIGQSCVLDRRYRDHLSIKQPKTHKDNWICYLRGLGLVPELIIIETTTQDQANEAEKYWIARYRFSGVNLTNQTDGGDGNSGFWIGRHHKPETIKKISLAKIGKKFSDDTKKKMSKARLGNKNGKGIIGIKRSQETRRKISDSKIGNNYGYANRFRLYESHTQETKDLISSKLIANTNNLGHKDSEYTRQLKSIKQQERRAREKEALKSANFS